MPEEPCQCPDCQRFYREHDRLIREFPTLRQQQELNWAALQSFRTLASRVLEDLQKQYGARVSHDSDEESSSLTNKQVSIDEINQAIGDIENMKPNGQGTLTLPNEYTYRGDFKDGKEKYGHISAIIAKDNKRPKCKYNLARIRKYLNNVHQAYK